jgi:sugar/nucleoside kinase (ribokinase family)
MALLDCEGAEVPALNSRFTLRVAGAELNFAIGLARLGIEVRWISRVGNDVFGRSILAALRAEGIDGGKHRRAASSTIERGQRLRTSSRLTFPMPLSKACASFI